MRRAVKPPTAPTTEGLHFTCTPQVGPGPGLLGRGRQAVLGGHREGECRWFLTPWGLAGPQQTACVAPRPALPSWTHAHIGRPGGHWPSLPSDATPSLGGGGALIPLVGSRSCESPETKAARKRVNNHQQFDLELKLCQAWRLTPEAPGPLLASVSLLWHWRGDPIGRFRLRFLVSVRSNSTLICWGPR